MSRALPQDESAKSTVRALLRATAPPGAADDGATAGAAARDDQRVALARSRNANYVRRESEGGRWASARQQQPSRQGRLAPLASPRQRRAAAVINGGGG